MQREQRIVRNGEYYLKIKVQCLFGWNEDKVAWCLIFILCMFPQMFSYRIKGPNISVFKSNSIVSQFGGSRASVWDISQYFMSLSNNNRCSLPLICLYQGQTVWLPAQRQSSQYASLRRPIESPSMHLSIHVLHTAWLLDATFRETLIHFCCYFF